LEVVWLDVVGLEVVGLEVVGLEVVGLVMLVRLVTILMEVVVSPQVPHTGGQMIASSQSLAGYTRRALTL
jgi:hypothetical protein